MSINSFSSNSSSMTVAQTNQIVGMSDEKKLEDILSKYDLGDMDESSLLKLKSELKDFDIQQGKGMGDKEGV